MTKESLPENSDGSAFTAALAAGAALSVPRTNPKKDGVAYAIVPPGYTVEPLPVESRPHRPSGTVHLRDVDSFIRYFNDHKIDSSRIYASMDPALFVAVFDDFCKNSVDPLTSTADQFSAIELQGAHREFRADFVIPPSREWKTWTGADRRKEMTQLSFAQHIEDNMPDIVDPTGDELYQIVLKFDLASQGRFTSTQRLQDGSHHLQWTVENKDAGTLKLPESIKLHIPVFENGDMFDLSARIRYRLSHEGKLTIWYELIRHHKVLEDAFRQTWKKILDGCGNVILLGKPE